LGIFFKYWVFFSELCIHQVFDYLGASLANFTRHGTKVYLQQWMLGKRTKRFFKRLKKKVNVEVLEEHFIKADSKTETMRELHRVYLLSKKHRKKPQLKKLVEKQKQTKNYAGLEKENF
jgi:uncharacterized membrane protein YheB (UPF0754 family)